MYCMYCGKALENGAFACRYCGGITRVVEDNAPASTSLQPKKTYLVTGVVPPTAEQPFKDNAHQSAPYKKNRNGYSIAGFVLSVISMTITIVFPLRSLFFSCYALVPLVGLIFSIIGIKKSKTLGSGKGLAVAGKIINVLLLAFFVAYFVLYI